MTRADELRKAAATLRERAHIEAILRDGDPYYDREASVWDRLMEPGMGDLLAETLETEAQLLDMLAPFTELLNATVEAQGGPKGALRLLMDEDGLPRVVTDSTPSWLRIARLINGDAA